MRRLAIRQTPHPGGGRDARFISSRRRFRSLRLTEFRAHRVLRLVEDGDAQPEAAPVGLIRARGELRLGFEAFGGVTRMTQAFQSGCLRVRAPRTHGDGELQAVLINTGGGVTGGDRLTQSASFGVGARAVIASQAAEKVYRSLGEDVRIDTRLDLAAGARAEWLPQETILFDRARLDRRNEVRLGPGASFLGVESVILGRAAMGEQVRCAHLSDRWRIWREGRLIYADAARLSGDVLAMMGRACIGAGAAAMAVILFVSEQAASMLGAVREALEGAACRAAASAWNGVLAVRFLAADGQSLRAAMLPVLSVMRESRPLPRVWTC